MKVPEAETKGHFANLKSRDEGPKIKDQRADEDTVKMNAHLRN
jgi:hypothetical protein